VKLTKNYFAIHHETVITSIKGIFLNRSQIDENKTSLTETKSLILMQEFFLNIGLCWIIVVLVEAKLMKIIV